MKLVTPNAGEMAAIADAAHSLGKMKKLMVVVVATRLKFANARRWYNGNEILREIKDQEDVFRALLDAGFDPNEQLAAIGYMLCLKPKRVKP